MRSYVVVAVAALALSATGCGEGSSPASPSAAATLTGSWAGSISSQLSGNGTARATLTQNGNTVSGTWTATFVDGTDAGTVDGQVSGQGLQLMLNPGDPTSCPYRLTATLSGGSTLSGTYTSVNCTISFGGSVTLTKQ